MSNATVMMLYQDYLSLCDEVEAQLKILCAKKAGTLRAARKNLEACYLQQDQIRNALVALGYMPTAQLLRRL